MLSYERKSDNFLKTVSRQLEKENNHLRIQWPSTRFLLNSKAEHSFPVEKYNNYNITVILQTQYRASRMEKGIFILRVTVWYYTISGKQQNKYEEWSVSLHF